MTPSMSRATPLDAIDTADVTLGVGVIASKLIRADDPYLSGHYPDFTIYPGVFVIESASQAVECYVAQAHGPRHRAILTGVDTVRFSRPMLPGDTLWLNVDCQEAVGILVAQVRCHDDTHRPTARMTLRFTVTEEPHEDR